MPVAIIFHGEDKIDSYFNDPMPWENTLKAFGIENITLVDTTIDHRYSGYGLNPDKKFSELDLEVAAKRYEGFSKVQLSTTGDIDLTDFKHPRNSVYVFGDDNSGGELTNPDFRVRIPVSNDLWAFGVMHIVLWDRMMKHGNNY